MPQPAVRLSRLAAVLGTLLALTGCGLAGTPAPSTPGTERELMAQYRGLSGNAIETETQRLRLLKQLAEGGTQQGEQFIAETLGGSAPAPQPATETKLSVWSEFLPFATVAQYLPALKARSLSLLVAVTPEKAQDPALLTLLQEAQRLGVEVRPWLLVSGEHGYWANKWNHAEVSRFVRETTSTLTTRGLKPAAITLDIEPPVSLTKQLAERLEKIDLIGARRVLVASSRDGSLTEARSAYQRLVSDLHGRGIRVHAVTTPMLLDDLVVGQGRLQSALGIPVAGVDWDEVTFMAYRTEFRNLAGRMGGDIVRRYAQDANRFFGSRAGLDLGVIGTPGFAGSAHGYTDPQDLAIDLLAARAGGIGRMNLFSLDGMLEQGGIDRWAAATSSAPIKREAKALFVRALVQTVARTLPAADARPKP